MQREKNMTYATAGVQMGAGIEMNVRSHVFIPDAEAGCEEVRSHYHAGYQVVRKKEITLSRNHAAILLLILAGILALIVGLKAVRYAFHGIRAGVLALLFKALWGMYKKSPKGWASYVVMGGAFVLTAA